MRTVRTKVYKFDELVVDAQQNAIEQYRNNNDNDNYHIWNEAEKTVNEFVKLFDIETGSRSWLEFKSHLTDEVENLTGLRLQKYIWNNIGHILFKGKFYNNLSKNEIVNHPRIKSKLLSNGNVFNPYYSAIIKDNSCVLTGVYYDDEMLKPLYDFLELREFNSTTLINLLSKCYSNLRKAIDDEIAYNDSDEAIKETLIENDYEFTSNGNLFSN